MSRNPERYENVLEFESLESSISITAARVLLELGKQWPSD
jgi:hypothetical protein